MSLFFVAGVAGEDVSCQQASDKSKRSGRAVLLSMSMRRDDRGHCRRPLVSGYAVGDATRCIAVGVQRRDVWYGRRASCSVGDATIREVPTGIGVGDEYDITRGTMTIRR